MLAISCLLLCLPFARTAVTFVPPSTGPGDASHNFGNPSNGSLPAQPVVPGQAFDRFIQIWLENADFSTASANTVLKQLATQGIQLTNYFGVTHPSEPNYIATVGGDFFGLADDKLHNIDASVSTIVDLLEQKNISWAEYEETMPNDGDVNFSESSTNYFSPGSRPRTFYVRKHNPLIIYDSVATVPERLPLIRNFNDFTADFKNSSLPQWMFVTPNLVDDGHDTDVTYAGEWLKFWLLPLLKDPRFNDNRTLILLTFDETETASPNNVYALLLGGAVPANLVGTVDNTFYTHYSALSTVQVNWGLNCLGRQDTNKTVSNVYSFVANATNVTNVAPSFTPDFSGSGTAPGPLNPKLFVPFSSFLPDATATCANPAGQVFVPGVGTTQPTPPSTAPGPGAPDPAPPTDPTAPGPGAPDPAPPTDPTAPGPGAPDPAPPTDPTAPGPGAPDPAPPTDPTAPGPSSPDPAPPTDPTAPGPGAPDPAPPTDPTAPGPSSPDPAPPTDPTSPGQGSPDPAPPTDPTAPGPGAPDPAPPTDPTAPGPSAPDPAPPTDPTSPGQSSPDPAPPTDPTAPGQSSPDPEPPTDTPAL